MMQDIEKLLDVARRTVPTKEQREEQRRSFAYGNTAVENDLITREMIDSEAERLDRERDVGREG